MNVRKVVSILTILAAATAAGASMESLRERSPFVPPSTSQPAGGEVNALSSFELTGILSVGGKPQFSVRDTSTNRGFWLGLGETQDGLTVRSYDEASSSVVLEGRGARRNLVIREARVTTAAPPPPVVNPHLQPAGPPLAAPQPGVAGPQQNAQIPPSAKKQAQAQVRDAKGRTNEEAERDARLLVSDLMEISIQERKRYEENQRRAAAGLPRLAPGEPLPQ